MYHCTAKPDRFEAHVLAVSHFSRWEEKFRKVDLKDKVKETQRLLEAVVRASCAVGLETYEELRGSSEAVHSMDSSMERTTTSMEQELETTLKDVHEKEKDLVPTSETMRLVLPGPFWKDPDWALSAVSKKNAPGYVPKSGLGTRSHEGGALEQESGLGTRSHEGGAQEQEGTQEE